MGGSAAVDRLRSESGRVCRSDREQSEDQKVGGSAAVDRQQSEVRKWEGLPQLIANEVKIRKWEGRGSPFFILRSLSMIRTGSKLGMDPRGAAIPDLLSQEVDTLRDILTPR